MSTEPLACIGAPVSWLRLERLKQGDLTGAERAEVTSHLAECAACSACLRQIEDDARELPPLPVRREPRRGAVVRLRSAAPVLIALAAAAAIFILVGRLPRPSPWDGAKGGEVSFALVREDEVFVSEGGGSYHDGERMKAMVTCPPHLHAAFDLVVYENGEASFPLPSAEGLSCGNQAVFPGAFRLTGHAPMRVCLVWSEDGPVDCGALRRAPPASMTRALCKELVPAP